MKIYFLFGDLVITPGMLLIRLLLLMMLISGYTSKGHAIELGLGVSAVEEGDDRIQPGVLLHLGWYRNFYSRFHYFGMKYGPIIERTYILSANYKLDIFKMLGNEFLFGSAGLAFMNEQTKISFSGDSENSENENRFNLGFQFGFFGEIPIPGPVFLRLGFESHLFLAGVNGILLANGRKNMISLAGGVDL